MTKRWRVERRRDKYYRKAKREHYRSRAVYKLKQLDYKYDIIRPGDVIVDLGASPGGWSQVAVELGGSESKVIAIDLDRMAPIDGVTFIRGDIREQSVMDRVIEFVPSGADVVLSDMSPDISGNYSYDHARSIELCEHALKSATTLLREGGNFLCKMFYGDMSGDFMRKVRPRFVEVHMDHPRASRASSSEVYIVGLDFKGRRR